MTNYEEMTKEAHHSETRANGVLASNRAISLLRLGQSRSEEGGRDIIATGGMIGRVKSPFVAISRDILWGGNGELNHGRPTQEKGPKADGNSGRSAFVRICPRSSAFSSGAGVPTGDWFLLTSARISMEGEHAKAWTPYALDFGGGSPLLGIARLCSPFREKKRCASFRETPEVTFWSFSSSRRLQVSGKQFVMNKNHYEFGFALARICLAAAGDPPAMFCGIGGQQCGNFHVLRVGKPAIQQAWKPALRGKLPENRGLTGERRVGMGMNNDRQYSTSSGSSSCRRRSRRCRRGLSKLNRISTTTHGWQRSWVFSFKSAVTGHNRIN
jgi:hypothetical protein